MSFLVVVIILIIVWFLLRRLFGKARQQEQRRRLFNDAEKKEILSRQGYACATCQNTEWRLFEFHHKKLFSDGGETTVENGVALCPVCHTKITKNYK